jgi:hypothetical protein
MQWSVRYVRSEEILCRGQIADLELRLQDTRVGPHTRMCPTVDEKNGTSQL